MKYTKYLVIAAVATLASVWNVSNAWASTPAPGTNVSANGVVYQLASDGSLRPYPGEMSFLSYGYNSWANVIPAPEDASRLKIGTFMPPRDGSVVCSNSENDKGTCYLITDYKKAAFASEQVFLQQGHSYKNALVGDVSYLELDKPIIDGSAAHRYGSLVSDSGKNYFVGKNGLALIPSSDILTSWGYRAEDVVPANSADLAIKSNLSLEARFTGEPRPFEPIIQPPLGLANKDKFILPLKISKTPELTEAWLYSNEERVIHGYANHGGIDFPAPRSTPVYAVADGYAVSSTHLSPLAKTYQDKQVGFGLGEFVQIWHPETGVYTSYSHLSKVEQNIPYFKPECDDTGFCDPEIVYNSVKTIKRKGRYVHQGDIIGYVGDSGLSWGYKEKPRGMRPNVLRNPSWDETHLHFEVFTRDPQTFFKAKRYDPFDIYGRLDQYTSEGYSKSSALWKLGNDMQPVLAK